MLDNMNPPAIIGEQIAGRSAAVRKQLVLLSGTISKNTFDVAELLFEADTSGYLASWGFKNLGDYSEKELGVKERKAQYLVRIVKVCREVGLTRAQYEPAGVSKLREITRLDPKGEWFNTDSKENEPMDDHIIDLIVEAPGLSREDVTEEVLKLQGMTGGSRPVVRSYSATKDAWELTIKRAMDAMRQRLGSAARDEGGMAVEYSDGVCIEMICADWLAGIETETEDTNIPMEDINGI